MKKALSLVLAFAACATHGTVPVHLPEDTPEHRQQVEQALAYFELGVEYNPHGLAIEFRNRDGNICGRAFNRTGCERAVWSCAKPHFVAHEIGHAFGLPHFEVTGNLMEPAPKLASTVNEHQRTAVIKNLSRFRIWCVPRMR